MRAQPAFLMTEPTHYGVSYEINPWMRPRIWSADPAAHLLRAQDLWRELRGVIEREGGVVHEAPGAPGLPDMVFPANAAVILDGRVLLARFRHPERAREEAPFGEVFRTLSQGGVVREIAANPGVVQEGAGDCIWDASRRLFWVGCGPRSSPDASAMIADHFGVEVVSLPLATDRYYHLDTCFCPLPGGDVLYYPPALDEEALRRLRERVAPEFLIEASDDDAQRFCVNAVAIGGALVMSHPSADLEQRLAGRSYRVAGVDVSPFILSGGGAFCMTLRLDLSSTDEPHSVQPVSRILEEVAA